MWKIAGIPWPDPSITVDWTRRWKAVTSSSVIAERASKVDTTPIPYGNRSATSAVWVMSDGK
jgi:hypothetical protein